MRKFYSLIMVCLFAMSLFGQSEINKKHTADKPTLRTFQNSKADRTGHQRSPRIVFQNQPTVSQKANRETMKALETMVSEYYDEGSDQWGVEDKTAFTYDESGNNTKQEDFYWDEEWVNYGKSEQEFNNDGNITQEAYYDWDDDLNQYIPSYKDEYSYDSDGKVSTIHNFTWDTDGNNWDNLFKDEYTYNPDGNLTDMKTYAWDGVSEVWNVSWKDEFTYDGDGNMILETAYTWTNEWVALWKYELTYNSNQDVITETNSRWENSTNEWLKEWKDEYTYDNDGNMVMFTSYDWEGQWVNSYKNDLIYDNSYTSDQLIMPWWWNDDDYTTYRHMVTGYLGYEWEEATSKWLEFARGTLTYIDHNVSGIFNSSSSAIKVYPNPATDYLSFDLKDNAGETTVELFDLKGRLVLKQTVSGKTKIQVNQLNKGLYMYKVMQNDKSYGGKVIVE